MFTLRNLVVLRLVVRARDVKTGQVVVNVLHFRPSKDATAYGVEIAGATSLGLLNGFATIWTGIMDNLSEHYNLESIEVTELTGRSGADITSGATDVLTYVPGSATGTLPGDAFATFVAASVRKRTARSGRSGRGGMRLSPIPEDKAQNGRLAGGYVDDLTIDVTPLTQQLAVAVGPPAVYGRFVVFSKTRAISTTLNGPFTETDEFAFPITSVMVNPNTGSQVSRKPRSTDVIDPSA